MAQHVEPRNPPLWVPAFGFALIAIAVWNTTDEAFCSSWCGNLTAPIFANLYSTFGHWGPRAFLIAIGLVFVLGTLFKRSRQHNHDA